jgi:indole-3-glycerol phosphate synthase
MADKRKSLVVRLDADVTDERIEEIIDVIMHLGMTDIVEVSIWDSEPGR